MHDLDLSQAQFLVAQASESILQELALGIQQGGSDLQLRKSLEKRYAPEECRALLSCAQAQHKHREKFADSSRWLLAPSAAEQASHQLLARWRADELSQRFPHAPLTEVGCGIGSDSVPLSRRFELVGYEQNSARATLCRHNLGQLGGSNWTVLEQTADLRALQGLIYCDPARRSHKRLSAPSDWSPPLPLLFDCVAPETTILVKVAPGILDKDLVKTGVEVEVDFLSVAGELKEAMLYLSSGPSHRSPLKRAVLCDQSSTVVLESSHYELEFVTPKPGQYLLNPDPAILRADLLNTLAEVLCGWGVHPKIGYLVSPAPAPPKLASSFLVEETFSLDWKLLKKRIASRDWTEYEYLGRGVSFSQTEVRKKLGKLKRKSSQASRRGSILIYREDRGYRVVLGERVLEGKP